jgi:UDP-N-acetylmuramoylalanine--D-glutamate ligase
MKVSVLGLGMEGKNAVKALLDYGNHVYASDLDSNIDIAEFKHADLDLELGKHDFSKIDVSDAIVLSPSLWNKPISKGIISKKKLLSDVLNDHKSIFTIGVTGTNGKTTTCHMIDSILKKSGLNVLLGGNAGGGFEGYTKLVLEASKHQYDIIVVEICDMTLDYASHVFDLDMVLVTNIGYDHMDFHGTLENYRRSVCKFLKGKKQAVLNEKDSMLVGCANCADETFFYGSRKLKLKLFGTFNEENASGAFKVAELLGISPKLSIEVLNNFNMVDGRTISINFNNTNIIIGKTDNSHAAAAVFNEVKMDVIIIGTPREDENWRYDILKEVSNFNPPIVILFPGLDSTTGTAKEILRSNGYDGIIYIVKEVSEVVKLTLKCTEKHQNIFIGGNGQKKITAIQKALLSISNSNI